MLVQPPHALLREPLLLGEVLQLLPCRQPCRRATAAPCALSWVTAATAAGLAHEGPSARLIHQGGRIRLDGRPVLQHAMQGLARMQHLRGRQHRGIEAAQQRVHLGR